jgi:hypothetical protein
MRALALTLALLVGAPARATECAPIAGGVPGLARIDANVRLTFVRERMRVAARRARIWTWTWGGLYSSLVVINLAQMPTADRSDLVDLGFGAGASMVGVLALSILPLKVMGDQRWLERRLRRGDDVCAQLADAERLLVRGAASQAFGKGPLVHAGNVVFNVGVLLALGIGFGHWDSAAINGLGGILVGEVMAFTQPTDAIHDLDNYRAADLTPTGAGPLRFTFLPMISRQQLGFSLASAF